MANPLTGEAVEAAGAVATAGPPCWSIFAAKKENSNRTSCRCPHRTCGLGPLVETLDPLSPATVPERRLSETARSNHLIIADSLVLPRSGGGRVGEPRISSST
jgi:hypothetical protein